MLVLLKNRNFNVLWNIIVWGILKTIKIVFCKIWRIRQFLISNFLLNGSGEVEVIQIWIINHFFVWLWCVWASLKAEIWDFWWWIHRNFDRYIMKFKFVHFLTNGQLNKLMKKWSFKSLTMSYQKVEIIHDLERCHTNSTS